MFPLDDTNTHIYTQTHPPATNESNKIFLSRKYAVVNTKSNPIQSYSIRFVKLFLVSDLPFDVNEHFGSIFRKYLRSIMWAHSLCSLSSLFVGISDGQLGFSYPLFTKYWECIVQFLVVMNILRFSSFHQNSINRMYRISYTIKYNKYFCIIYRHIPFCDYSILK